MKDKYGEASAMKMIADDDDGGSSSTSETEDEDGEVSFSPLITKSFNPNVCLIFKSSIGMGCRNRETVF